MPVPHRLHFAVSLKALRNVSALRPDAGRPALNVATPWVAFVPLDLGGAAVEAEFIDAFSGERLAAMVERKKDSPTNLKGGFTAWGHAKTAFREWAVELAQALKTHP